MTCVSFVVVLAVLSLVCSVPRPVLMISGGDILSGTGSHIFTKELANLTLTCTGSGNNGGPDLDIGGSYVTSNGSLANVIEQTEFSGDVVVSFCSACDVTTVSITNLARTTNSTETVLRVKCKETRVGDSEETIVSIFTGKWGEWGCDPEQCTMTRRKDCLNPEKGVCEDTREGCQGADQQCSKIPAVDVRSTHSQRLVEGSVTVTVGWSPPSHDFTAQVTLTLDGETKVGDGTFTGLTPDTTYEGSVVLVNKAGRKGEEKDFIFRTIPQYLTIKKELSKDSRLTISWEKIRGCKDNIATVYLNDDEHNTGADTFFSFLYDQTKTYSIRVVSRGCGDIVSPDISLHQLDPITELTCAEAASSVKCSYTTKVNLILTCQESLITLEDELEGGNTTTYQVDDGQLQGEVDVKVVDVCSKRVRVACKAVSSSGAVTTAEDLIIADRPRCETEPVIPIAVTTPGGHHVVDPLPENSSQGCCASTLLILTAFVVFNLN